MELLLITLPENEDLEIPFLKRMFLQGLQTLHLRKPGWFRYEVQRFLAEIPKEFHNRIVLHDHFELAIEYDLKGIHFTEKGKANFHDWKDFQGLKSWAVHHEDELLNLPEEVDYVLLSPIFKSITKPDYKGKLNLKKAVEYLNSDKISAKVYGLGGVDLDKLPELKSMGFNGAALLGGIWEQFFISPENAYFHWEDIKEVCQKL